MKKRVLIADADREFRTELTTALGNCDEFEVVGIATDGEEVLHMLKEQRPDMLVMDLLLTKYDGLTVLQFVQSMHKRPQVLAVTAFISNYIAVSAARMGVQQLIHKPCDVSEIIRCLRRMMKNEDYGSAIFLWNGNQSMESLVTSILHDIGVPAHIKGYQYLREAILLAVRDDDWNAIRKVRYYEVADTFGTMPKRVERAIRHAVEVAWDRGDLDTLQRYFGYTVSNTKGKPTNSEFISIVADRIRLWLKENNI